jgi:hypothetical protein
MSEIMIQNIVPSYNSRRNLVSLLRCKVREQVVRKTVFKDKRCHKNLNSLRFFTKNKSLKRLCFEEMCEPGRMKIKFKPQAANPCITSNKIRGRVTTLLFIKTLFYGKDVKVSLKTCTFR